MPNHTLSSRIALLALGASFLAACSQSHGPADDTPGGRGTEPAAAAPAASAEQKAARLAALPAPYNASDLANGEKQYNKCRTCHTLYEGEMALIGPNLYTVFGRKSGTLPGYVFSDAMKAHDVVWDYASLDAYLQSPQTVVKGTKMGYLGVKSDTDRRDLIAFIRIETMKAQ